jgi:formate hydrogenlyase transcriptional activator
MCAERMSKQIETILTEVMEALVGHSWSGNIRELQNFIERSVILTSGNVLRSPVEDLNRVAGPESLAAITLRDAERDHIRKALEHTRWFVGGPSTFGNQTNNPLLSHTKARHFTSRQGPPLLEFLVG